MGTSIGHNRVETPGVKGNKQFAEKPVHDADDGVITAAARAHTSQLISTIAEQMAAITAEQVSDVSLVQRALIDGSWRDWHDRGLAALRDMAAADPEDDLREQSDDVYANEYERHGHEDPSSEWYATLSSAENAARAVAYRDRIGTVPGWSQGAYDYVTRPWRTVVGQVHPDDEVTPANWAQFPLDTEQVTEFSAETAVRHAEAARAKDPEFVVVSDLPALDVEGRTAVAEQTCRDSVLQALAADVDADVRYAVARNPDTGIDTLWALALDDADERVRKAARFSSES